MLWDVFFSEYLSVCAINKITLVSLVLCQASPELFLFIFPFCQLCCYWAFSMLPQPWQSAYSRPLKMAGWIYMNNLLNQTGSLQLLSPPNCTCVYIMVPVLLKQGSMLLTAAAYYPIHFRMGQIFPWRPLSFNHWLQKDPRWNEAPNF